MDKKELYKELISSAASFLVLFGSMFTGVCFWASCELNMPLLEVMLKSLKAMV